MDVRKPAQADKEAVFYIEHYRMADQYRRANSES